MRLLGDDGSSASCDSIHSVHNATNQCWFVKHTASCAVDEGFVNYTELLYCGLDKVPVWFGCVLLVVWWLFMFSGLAVTADDFFCPSLAVISRSLKLSHNVAGVTFLAFGNGAPDVFSAVAAISNAKAGDAGLAIGALFGAGVFVTTVVAGSIAIARPFKCMERPLMRDVIFYLAATYWAWLIMWDKKITQVEAAGLLVLYVVYVAVVIGGRYVNQKLKSLNQSPQEVVAQDPLLRGTLGNTGDGGGQRLTYDSTSPTVRLGTQDIMNSLLDSGESTVSISSSDGILSSSGSGSGGNIVSAGSPNIQVEIETATRSRQGLKHVVSVSKVEEVLNLWRIFLAGANPINTEEWADLGLHWKIYEVFKSPIVLCLKLTVPVVDMEEDEELKQIEDEALSNSDSSRDDSSEVKVLVVKGDSDVENDLRNWNRPLNSFQIFLGLFFASIATGVGTKTIGGTFPVYVLVLVVALVVAVVVFVTTSTNKRPRFHTGFAYLGFVVAVVWIYCIANEIVNILQALGIAFNLSDAILGLTFLAWGNSIGDLIADISMARQGYPRMGISACFGGPLFNMLIGLGIPFSFACAEHGGVFHLKINLEEMILAAGLTLSLVSTLIIVPLSKFQMSRPYGLYLLALYLVFLLVAILTEVNVIKNVKL